MTKTRAQVFALAAILSVAGAVSGLSHSLDETPDATLASIAGYKQWTRVTKKPVPKFQIDAFD
jgi:hypothetical protein